MRCQVAPTSLHHPPALKWMPPVAVVSRLSCLSNLLPRIVSNELFTVTLHVLADLLDKPQNPTAKIRPRLMSKTPRQWQLSSNLPCICHKPRGVLLTMNQTA